MRTLLVSIVSGVGLSLSVARWLFVLLFVLTVVSVTSYWQQILSRDLFTFLGLAPIVLNVGLTAVVGWLAFTQSGHEIITAAGGTSSSRSGRVVNVIAASWAIVVCVMLIGAVVLVAIDHTNLMVDLLLTPWFILAVFLVVLPIAIKWLR